MEGQLLTTGGDVGYVVTDVGTDYVPEVVDALVVMKETIRLRVLS